MFSIAEVGSLAEWASVVLAFCCAVVSGVFTLRSKRAADRSAEAAERSERAKVEALASTARAVEKLAQFEESNSACRFQIESVAFLNSRMGRELSLRIENHSTFEIAIGYAEVEGDGELKVHASEGPSPCFSSLPLVIGARMSADLPITVPHSLGLGRLLRATIRTQTGESASFDIPDFPSINPQG